MEPKKTREQSARDFLDATGEAVLALLVDGPDAVTTKAVYEAVGCSSHRLFRHDLGNHDALLAHGIRCGVRQVLRNLEEVRLGAAKGSDLVWELIRALVPTGLGGPEDPGHKSYLWVLWLAGSDMERSGSIAKGISDVLEHESPHFHQGLGWGVFGVIRGCVHPDWQRLTRQDVHDMLWGMTFAVTNFDQDWLKHPERDFLKMSKAMLNGHL